jgi:NodT family efflux transporter outer membrane factor (OMF) lipoprotein
MTHLQLRRAGRSQAVALFGVLAATFGLGGCAVGPDFKKPDAPSVGQYTAAPLPAKVSGAPGTAGEEQRFVNGSDIAADWWTLFHSKPLDELIARAIHNNSDLKAAQAALRQANENVLAQKGAYFPTVVGSFAASRQRQPASLAPIPGNNALQFDLFTPQVSVSYTPDVFGLNRRTVESLEAQSDAARYQMLATYNTLVSNVVVTAITLAAVDAEIDATNALIADNGGMIDIVQYQFGKGYASGVDLAAQKSQAAQLAATLPPLMKQAAQLRDQLAVLAGSFPSEAGKDPVALTDLTLPTDIPLSLPSVLVEQRPDILQAEANLHTASANIGVAIANRLPNIQLSANAGSTALAIGQLFTPGNNFWTLASTLTAPIFDGGTLLHQERAARAAYDQAAAQYKGAVLTAFQNVADTLTALEQDGDGLSAAATAEDAARTTRDLAERQLKDGYASPLQLLNAEQTWQQARINLVLAQSTRLSDTAALFDALGGGWWHQTDLKGDKHDE